MDVLIQEMNSSKEGLRAYFVVFTTPHGEGTMSLYLLPHIEAIGVVRSMVEGARYVS